MEAGLLGRRRETARLTALLDRGGDAGGAALLVLGDPGIGKSALLEAVGGHARQAGWRVLSTTGVESEAHLPFAGLHQLLRPVLDRAHRLDPGQREALLTAFGLADGARPDPYAIMTAAHRLLECLAEGNPVLVLADDVQWQDPQTHATLAFLARRSGRGIVVVGSVRSGHEGPFVSARLPELVVVGVADDAAEQILRRHAVRLTDAERRRIREEAVGNPLALLELPTAAPGTGGLPARLERAFAARLGELPPRTRDAVLVAAVDPADGLGEILEAVANLSGEPVDAGVFGAAARVRLVSVTGDRVLFRHPLVRSGVLQAEGPTRRQAANAALADVLVDEPYRRTWHRAQSIVGPDDEIAAELEANVAVALRRGGVMSAIADLERSAELTSVPARRGHRLLLAAEHAFGLGRVDLVTRLVRAAAATDLGDLDQARMEWLSEIFNDGVPGDAARVLELCAAAVRSAAAGDLGLALNLLLGAGLRCWWAEAGQAARSRVVEVLARTPGGDDPRHLAALAVAEPVRRCEDVLNRLSRVAALRSAEADDLRLVGMAAHAIGDEVRATDLLDRAEALLREQSRFGLLPHVLSMQVQIRTELGNWAGALAAAEEGRRLAEETGQPIWNIGTLVCEAKINALRGDADRALRLAAEAELAALPKRLNDLLTCVRLARGCAWLSDGQPEAAYAELRRLFDPGDPSFHQRERFAGVMYLAEAASRAGRREDATAVVRELDLVAARTPSPILRVHLLYARAVLAADDDAEDRYLAALGADLTRWPWVRARIELAYGAWLWRRGRPSFRAPLRSALAVFDSIGAVTWSRQAQSLLEAS